MITIGISTSAVIDEVVAISDSRFGRNYLNEHDFLSLQSQLLVAQHNGDTIGFLLYQNVSSSHVPLQLMDGKPWFYVQSLAVKEGHDGFGAGTLLLQKVLEAAELHGVTSFYSHLWISGGVAQAWSIFEKFGFRIHSVIDLFWHQQSIEKGFHCPVCGNPCECSALLVFLNRLPVN